MACLKYSACWVAVFVPLAASAQIPLKATGENVHLNSSDMAVLEAQDVRKDIACTVDPAKPVLGFDLRYHVQYEMRVPLKDIAGPENLLTILFRVAPKDHKSEPSYFSQHLPVPKIDEDAKGQATFNGVFDVGEGSYHVDLLLRDRSERVCSFYWDSDANLDDRDKQMELGIAKGAIERYSSEQFWPEPAVQKAPGTPLNLKILVNFAPQDQDSSTLRPVDTLALVTILRRLSREPRFGQFTIVAFNVQEQKELFRQSGNQIDFPALGKAIRSVQPGKTDFRRLAEKHGEVDFLTALIKKEMAAKDRPDALIFAGPKVLLDDAVPEDELKPFATDVDFPVYYVSYALDPKAIPWRDSIGKSIRPFHGVEFSINRPRDIWYSVTDLVSRIVKSKQGRNSVSSQ